MSKIVLLILGAALVFAAFKAVTNPINHDKVKQSVQVEADYLSAQEITAFVNEYEAETGQKFSKKQRIQIIDESIKRQVYLTSQIIVVIHYFE